MTARTCVLAGVLMLAICSAPASAQQVGSHIGFLRSAATDRDFRIGAFRHMENVFPNRVISRGGPVIQIPRAERPLDVSYEFKGHTRKLSDIMDRTNTTGLLVIKNGKIVFEKYYLGADDNSMFTSMSVAKSFTSTLVGLAIADGKVASVDRPVTDYIPELHGSGYDGVSIKNILQMSSGVKFNEDYGGRDDLSDMWSRTMERNALSLDDYARSLPREEQPGAHFYYRSVDTQVLGWLVSRATGEHPADYLSRKIWQPLGMEHNASWLTDGAGTEAAFCCIQATLRDYGRFGMLFLNHGMANGNQIVPAKWVDEATTPGSPQVQPGKLMPGNPLGYQFQWWTFPGAADHAYSAEGVFFQFIYVNPRENVVIVKTSANDSFWDPGMEAEIYAAYDAITSALHGN